MNKTFIALFALVFSSLLNAEAYFNPGSILEDSIKTPDGNIYSLSYRLSSTNVTVNTGEMAYSYTQQMMQWELSKLEPYQGTYRLDPSFGVGGVKLVWSGPLNNQYVDYPKPRGLVYAPQGSGSLYLFGFERVLKVDRSGQAITSFGANGELEVNTLTSNLGKSINKIYQVSLDGEGKLVVALEQLIRPFTWSAYEYPYATIIRLFADGAIDLGFTGTTIGHYYYQFYFSKTLILSNGNILVLGTTKDPNNQYPITATLLSGATGTYLPFWPASYTPSWWAHQSVVYTGKIGTLEALWQNADGSIRSVHKMNNSTTRLVLGFKTIGLDAAFGTSGIKYVTQPTNYNLMHVSNINGGLIAISASKTIANNFLIQRYYDTGKNLVLETASYPRNWNYFVFKKTVQIDDTKYFTCGNVTTYNSPTAANVFAFYELPKN